MNDLELSTNLSEIELEIQWYKENVGRSVWEIGRRLIHVKENDLVHGEFIEWVENKVKIDRTTAYRFMKVSKELPNDDTWQHLGNRALYLIATLPAEEREKEHSLESGETKTPDQMVVRELEEVKKKLREKEGQLHQAKRSEKIAIDQLEKEQNKEPEVIEKVIEKPVIPDDYQYLERVKKELGADNRRLTEETNQLKRQLQKFENDTAEVERLERTIEQLNEQKAEVNQILDANEKLTELEREFHIFFDKNMAPVKYKPLVNELQEFNGVERMKKLVSLTRNWVEDMEQMLPNENRKIIEGEIIND